MNTELANKLYQLMIDTDGNPSISQIKELGYSEGQAIELIIRMANADRKKLVEISKANLGR
jgi:hypothetical protein